MRIVWLSRSKALLLHNELRPMRTSVTTATLVALSLLGQPIAATLCALECHSEDVARTSAEHNHCTDDGTRHAGPAMLTSGVAFCNHAVAIATTTLERESLVRPAPAAFALPIALLGPQAGVRVAWVIHNQGPPGPSTAPLPLRL